MLEEDGPRTPVIVIPQTPQHETPTVGDKGGTPDDADQKGKKAGTKKSGTKVGTKHSDTGEGTKHSPIPIGAAADEPTTPIAVTPITGRHASWAEDFNPLPHYITSRNSKTGFRGVSFAGRKGYTYRVKVGNKTKHRTDDLHEACQVFYDLKQAERKQRKAEKKRSKLDDLTFE